MQVPDAVVEFSSVFLGDARLDRRLGQVVGALQDRPDAGFPQAMGDDASTEAFYRFLANPKVSAAALLQGHTDETWARAVDCEVVFAVHDTSLFQFQGDEVREGTFRTAKGKCGFLGHVCLAVAGDGSRLPLGVVGMLPVVRPEQGAPVEGPGLVYENESQRWHDLIAIIDDEAPQEPHVVHVLDREGDAYELLDLLTVLDADYVVRLAHDRRVLTRDGRRRLSDILPDATTRLTRSVQLSRRTGRKRPPATRKIHPARDERTAHLEVRALQTWLVRPDGADATCDEIPVNIVHVVEPDPPPGEAPVSWLLATPLCVETAEDVAAIVDAYRARWLIEEFFKALKTGCAYEKRQLESLDNLLIAFSLLTPIAWRLLALRWMARNERDRPATDIFTAEELALLRHVDGSRRKRLPATPTIRQAMFAVARLGGFLQSNKEPGWQTLGRGLMRLCDLSRGLALARQMAQLADGRDGSEM